MTLRRPVRSAWSTPRSRPSTRPYRLVVTRRSATSACGGRTTPAASTAPRGSPRPASSTSASTWPRAATATSRSSAAWTSPSSSSACAAGATSAARPPRWTGSPLEQREDGGQVLGIDRRVGRGARVRRRVERDRPAGEGEQRQVRARVADGGAVRRRDVAFGAPRRDRGRLVVLVAVALDAPQDPAVGDGDARAAEGGVEAEALGDRLGREAPRHRGQHDGRALRAQRGHRLGDAGDERQALELGPDGGELEPVVVAGGAVGDDAVGDLAGRVPALELAQLGVAALPRGQVLADRGAARQRAVEVEADDAGRHRRMLADTVRRVQRRRLVRVPASTANLGPGFDAFAAALALHLEAEVVETGSFAVVTDLDVPRDRTNLLVRAFEQLAPADDFEFRVRSDIPLVGGLGSSAAAIVAGLTAADHLFELDRDILALAAELEGHPDNVSAAIHGGIVVVADGRATRVEPPIALETVLVVPDDAVATRAARAALPDAVPLADAAFNVAHGALLALGLATGDLDLISRGLADRLHQPHRAHLFPRSAELIAQARDIGALGATLSGAGPSVLVWCHLDQTAGVIERLRREVEGWATVQRVPFEATGADVRSL